MDQAKRQSLFPLEVSDQDFNVFHTIDRDLYRRLVQSLGREAAESVQVMAFWMWLERETNDMKLIKRLLSLPPVLLNEIADETRVCLMCLESDKFEYNAKITLLPEILNCPVVSLGFLHENRSAVLRNVSKIINTVCVRAFRDIPGRVRGESSRADAPFVPGGLLIHQRHVVMNNDVGEMLLNRNHENVVGGNLPVDDRTVFLTFSKGYPTAEDEVKEYFTRRFGDFIEDLIFQDVGDDEQVLYARMVVKPVAVGVIEEIVGRGNKAKYTINGKHVWARKYVKKSRSPPRGGRSQMAAP